MKLLVANWKMNPLSVSQAIRLAKAEDLTGVVIAPSFVHLGEVKEVIKRAVLGAQDTFWGREGAATGEISPVMLKTLGVRYVILGHSERRCLTGETDEMINKKIQAALAAGLKPILCVGEPTPVRRKGMTAAQKFVKTQLQKDLKGVKRPVIIAYEPIWAIGTGKADKPEETAKIHRFIKKLIPTQVIYGGSMTSKNIKSFLKYKEIGGALVGGASLNAGEFRKIFNAASQPS